MAVLSGLQKTIYLARNLPDPIVVNNINKLNSFVVTKKQMVNNVGTLTTSTSHGFTVGQYVSVEGIDSIFNGSHLVTDISIDRETNVYTFSFFYNSDPATNVSLTTVTGTSYSTYLSIYACRYRIVSGDKKQYSIWSPVYTLVSPYRKDVFEISIDGGTTI
jgi:hypothetical protein